MLRANSSRIGVDVRGALPLPAGAGSLSGRDHKARPAAQVASNHRAEGSADASASLNFLLLCTALGLVAIAHSVDADVLEHNLLVALSIVLMLLAVKGGGAPQRTRGKTR